MKSTAEYWVKLKRSGIWKSEDARLLQEEPRHPRCTVHICGDWRMLGCKVWGGVVHCGIGVVIYMLDARGCWSCKIRCLPGWETSNCSSISSQQASALESCQSVQTLHYLTSFRTDAADESKEFVTLSAKMQLMWTHVCAMECDIIERTFLIDESNLLMCMTVATGLDYIK